MNAFASALAVLFRDPHIGSDAVYRAGGQEPGFPVRVIRRAPDEIASYREGRYVVPTVFLDVSISAVAAVARGDTFEIGGDIFTVTGDPTRDEERLVWQVELREA